MQDVARRLFAEVLESTGGGLRIPTLPGFCQQLLTAFPLEADLPPGFRPLDQREQAALARPPLADLSVLAPPPGYDALHEALQAHLLRIFPTRAENFLLRCAAQVACLEACPG